MREIKYRGKRIDNDEWVHGYLIGNDVIVGEIVDWDTEYFCTEFWLKVDPETVGQYTGLKDKNGKEIYEGDISQSEHLIYEIKWVERCTKYGVKVIKSPFVLTRGCTFPLQDYVKEGTIQCWFEVIGNIHEHPHLLEA